MDRKVNQEGKDHKDQKEIEDQKKTKDYILCGTRVRDN